MGETWLKREEVSDAFRKIVSMYGEKPIGVVSRSSETEFCFAWGPEHMEPYGVLPIEGGFLRVYAR